MQVINFEIFIPCKRGLEQASLKTFSKSAASIVTEIKSHQYRLSRVLARLLTVKVRILSFFDYLLQIGHTKDYDLLYQHSCCHGLLFSMYM